MSANSDYHGVGHLVPVRVLVTIGVALLFLTIVTVAVAQFDFGAANIWVALAVAGVKASLVVLYFMHLRYDRPFNSFVFVGSIAFVLLFIGFALTDTSAYRGELATGNSQLVEQALTTLEAETAASN